MKNNNHKLTSFKMVRKRPKIPSSDTGERRDLWNILGFIFFVGTVCIVATFTMRSHQAALTGQQRSRRSGSPYQMCKLTGKSSTGFNTFFLRVDTIKNRS